MLALRHRADTMWMVGWSLGQTLSIIQGEERLLRRIIIIQAFTTCAHLLSGRYFPQNAYTYHNITVPVDHAQPGHVLGGL